MLSRDLAETAAIDLDITGEWMVGQQLTDLSPKQKLFLP